MEDPPKKFFRLAPGREVRLRYAYLVTLRRGGEGRRSGEVVELRCSYDPATRGGDAPDGRKVKGTLHWVSARARSAGGGAALRDALHGRGSDGRRGARLHRVPEPGLARGRATRCVEPSLAGAAPGRRRVQFERLGYFCADPDSTPARPVLNRTVTLRDTWAKLVRRGEHDVP